LDYPPANVKDFVEVSGPQASGTSGPRYIAGVPPIVDPYISGGKYFKSFEVRVTTPDIEDYTLTEHGSGGNPIDVSTMTCTWEHVDGSPGTCNPGAPAWESCSMEAPGDAYIAYGWVCIQLNTPDPEDL
jgi:hypothetical protein